MPKPAQPAGSRSSAKELSGSLILLIAIACGAMVANIYYAQTLIEEIAGEIGLSARAAGAITTLTQLGYGAGLFLLVPLGDLFENKRLALASCAGTAAGCIGIGFSHGAAGFLLASALLGFCATGAQVLVPLASHLARPERQGHVIGLVMSGLLAGIMLARPAASYLAHLLGWRAVFLGSAGLMAAIGIALACACPQRRPDTRMSYGAVVGSVFAQLRTHRTLRLRAAYQAVLFAAFNLFWTAAPLTLIHRFGLSQEGIALFALAGAGGALAAPIAGRLADRGMGWKMTLGALLTITLCFLAADLAVAALSVLAFALSAIVLDAAAQMNQITGQRIILGLSSEARARINAAYMGAMFLVGATGSVIGTVTYETGGWTLSALTGAAMGAAVLTLFLAFDRGASRTGG